MNAALAVIFKPFALFAFLVVCAIAVHFCRKLPNGIIRKILLKEI